MELHKNVLIERSGKVLRSPLLEPRKISPEIMIKETTTGPKLLTVPTSCHLLCPSPMSSQSSISTLKTAKKEGLLTPPSVATLNNKFLSCSAPLLSLTGLSKQRVAEPGLLSPLRSVSRVVRINWSVNYKRVGEGCKLEQSVSPR